MTEQTIEGPQFCASTDEIPAGAERIDYITEARVELFFIDHPERQKSAAENLAAARALSASSADPSVWVYLPWRHVAIHIPEEEAYFRLRTARNRNLITPEEQRAYRASSVAIAGLSIGSTVAATLVQTGGPRTLKLADPDTIEISNLNRMRAHLVDIGMRKVEVAARAAWDIDPFADLHLYPEGVNAENLQEFLSVGDTSIDVCVDEMDSIDMKFAIRRACKGRRIPVVMATDNGDGVILDIERYDTDDDYPIFHGRVAADVDKAALSRADFLKAASEIIDASLFTEKQASSMREIGKTLSGVPQLGTAAALSGVAAAYAVRAITTGSAELPSGRYVLACEDAFTEAAARSTD